MATLILHIGPGKCGSSSIQQFFALQANPCIQSTNYKLLDPIHISELNCELPSVSKLASFIEQLSANIVGYDAFILSHEFLFQCPYAIKNICRLASRLVTKIIIIGYSRRQAEFLISAYSQWLFLSENRNNEITKVLDDKNLDPILFTGLEKLLIASIANDFYSARQLLDDNILDWYVSYMNISQLVHESGAEIKCGVLPNNDTGIPLIQDFCEKSELILQTKMQSAIQQNSNLSFNQDVIEACNNAVAFGFDVPHPRDSNEVFELLSANMSPITQTPSVFLSNLKSYIDTFYLDSNKRLCKEYALSEEYFEPLVSYNKSEIMAMIINEGEQRSLNKSDIIDQYRMLSARMVELCINLAKGR